MAQLEDGNEKVTNSVIPNGTEAKVMRNLIENKGLLNGKGKLYAGTDDTTSTGAPVTTAIDPSGAVDGSVLIKDSTKDGGWTVGQVTSANIAAGAVTSANIAAGAVTSEQTHFEDKITIYPSNPTNGPKPTVISLPFAPVGSSQQVNLKLPNSSGQLINQDYVDDQKFASQIPKTTLAYGQYSTPSMALDYGQSVTFTVTIIGTTHENGGDTSGIIESVTMGNPPFGDGSIWLRGGRVVSYTETTVTLSFTNPDSSTVFEVPWGIKVSYAQPAYMAQIAQKTDFSNAEWITHQSNTDKVSVNYGESYEIFTYGGRLDDDYSINDVAPTIITIPPASWWNETRGQGFILSSTISSTMSESDIIRIEENTILIDRDLKMSYGIYLKKYDTSTHKWAASEWITQNAKFSYRRIR